MVLALLAMLLTPPALAGPQSTADSLERLEEVLQLRLEDGRLDKEQLLPAIVVSTQPRYQESAGWFGTRSLQALQGALGDSGIRVCEACMAPRVWSSDGTLAWQTGPVSLEEVIRLDDQARGRSLPARTAIWVEESAVGVSLRIVDLGSGRVVLAQNFDPGLVEHDNSQRMYSLSAELERRARGDSLTQAFFDVAFYPNQHIALDWTDQWGPTNANLSGVTLTILDPFLGVGAVHYRRVNFFDTLVGFKLVASLPRMVVNNFQTEGSDVDSDFLAPLLTGVGVVRVPFGRSNYGALLTVSTNGRVGLGVSLMNISLLPIVL